MISIALPPTRIAGAGGGVSWPTKQKKKNKKSRKIEKKIETQTTTRTTVGQVSFSVLARFQW